MKRRILRTAALVLLLATAAWADPVDDYVRLQMERQRIPGLSLAVVQDGRLIKLAGYGLANVESNIPVTPETVYEIGSLSKPFIATGIMRLVADGKVALTDSVSAFLEGAPGTWKDITVRHVLSHTGGLPREAPSFDPLKIQPDADVIRSAYAIPLAFAPGEGWQYSNLGYFVLAEVIAKASGIPWPRFLNDRIFTPLGMTATRLTDMAAIVPNRANGYVVRNDRYENAPVVLAVRPSGALLSSVADLLRWDSALGDGRVLPVSTLEAMWTPVKLKNGGTARYGLGWQLDGQGSSRMIHHPGSIAGFQADYVRFPDHNLSIIVLANQDVALPTSVALGVATIYAPSLVPPRIPVQVNPAVLSQYVGSYRLASGATVLVELRDGALYLRPGMTAKEVRLEPESPTSFFADSGDPRLRYVFIRETGGRVLGLSLMDGKSELDRGDRVP